METTLPMSPPSLTGKRTWPWHWLIFLPVLVSVIAGLTTLGIAIRYGDKPLPESVMRKGPVQYGDNQGLSQAHSLNLSAVAQTNLETHGIVLTLTGEDLPAQLTLRLWHPTEASQDQVLLLTRGDDGSYRGAWPGNPQGMRLLLSAPELGWEMPGVVDATDHTLRFTP